MKLSGSMFDVEIILLEFFKPSWYLPFRLFHSEKRFECRMISPYQKYLSVQVIVKVIN